MATCDLIIELVWRVGIGFKFGDLRLVLVKEGFVMFNEDEFKSQ